MAEITHLGFPAIFISKSIGAFKKHMKITTQLVITCSSSGKNPKSEGHQNERKRNRKERSHCLYKVVNMYSYTNIQW